MSRCKVCTYDRNCLDCDGNLMEQFILIYDSPLSSIQTEKNKRRAPAVKVQNKVDISSQWQHQKIDQRWWHWQDSNDGIDRTASRWNNNPRDKLFSLFKMSHAFKAATFGGCRQRVGGTSTLDERWVWGLD